MAEDKDLIAYCGLYCGECFGYQGKIADLARDLRKELRACRFDKTAESLSEVPFFKAYQNYPQCYEVLGAMVRLLCKMRKCCQKKGIDGCWECADFESCDKLDFLKANHGDAHIKNLRILSKKGVAGFLAGKKYWYSAPARKENA